MNQDIYLLGIDVGSTTVKTVVVSNQDKIVYSNYQRHLSAVKTVLINQLKEIDRLLPNALFKVAITGSAGMGLATKGDLPFVQEVQGTFLAVKKYYPDVDCVIELGGEDAKIIFLTNGLEERMNGSCAGGTGAFIDQMASLLNIQTSELDKLALNYQKIYPIASRCGVFAKSDIQPLLNQGAKREDVCMSIYHAVVDQTISGLAQGRKITGKVLFLGGPLSFLKGLQQSFVSTLHLTNENAIFPENGKIFMALGASCYASKQKKIYSLNEICQKIENADLSSNILHSEPLFKSEREYAEFLKEHQDFKIKYGDIKNYQGKAYLGIDAGSTTTKLVLLSDQFEILYSHYSANNGQPIDKIVEQLKEIYEIANPNLKIVSGCVTGYGEALIKAALKIEFGLVETVAHYKAASFFEKDVDFIIDIGGQDIKCFKIKNGAIDSIMLNEACSSGCGSFIQAFANSMKMGVRDFAHLGLFAKHPVELGSRCTVFMNSSVKQAQKEGANLEDISAGLSTSIVKNAIYKVIRFKSPDELGNKIIVQGGTFLNDAILRAFEMEVHKKVIRPSIAGLMGAFGAAIYAKEKNGHLGIISKEELKNFTYKAIGTICRACTAYCNLTIITFNDKRRFISGNKCEKGEGREAKSSNLDLFEYKYKKLLSYNKKIENPKGKVGLPLGLGMYEFLPLWTAFFNALGFEVIYSNESSRSLYFQGQHTIPSDTVCYPAKLFHGHIESLLSKHVDFIFYPSSTYNLDEKNTSNHFNCPIVAYYGELIKQNNSEITKDNFLDPFIDLNDFKPTVKTLKKYLIKYDFSSHQISSALKEAFKTYFDFKHSIYLKGQEIISEARTKNKDIIVLAGRPYHLDKEINHGIDKLINSLDLAVISEDVLSYDFNSKLDLKVLNQWTYHARLYKAANVVCKNPDMQLIQLVSFGCGLDAITSDEVRRILEENNKFYTQLKIDEISNLGAIRIRLRSLKAAMEEKEEREHE